MNNFVGVSHSIPASCFSNMKNEKVIVKNKSGFLRVQAVAKFLLGFFLFAQILQTSSTKNLMAQGRTPLTVSSTNGVILAPTNFLATTFTAGAGVYITNTGGTNLTFAITPASGTNTLWLTNGTALGSFGTVYWDTGVTGYVSGATIHLGVNVAGGGGGGGVSTNDTQFGAAGSVLTLKDGVALTNITLAGNWVLDGNGAFFNVFNTFSGLNPISIDLTSDLVALRDTTTLSLENFGLFYSYSSSFMNAVEITNVLKLSHVTASRIAIFDALKQLTNSANVDTTELEFLDGVTSAIQTQLTTATNRTETKQHGSLTLTNLAGTGALTNGNGISLTNASIYGLTVHSNVTYVYPTIDAIETNSTANSNLLVSFLPTTNGTRRIYLTNNISLTNFTGFVDGRDSTVLYRFVPQLVNRTVVWPSVGNTLGMRFGTNAGVPLWTTLTNNVEYEARFNVMNTNVEATIRAIYFQ